MDEFFYIEKFDTDDVSRLNTSRARLMPLAQKGLVGAQLEVVRLDAEIHSACLEEQTEWDQQSADYSAQVSRYLLGEDDDERAPLAKPFVLYTTRPVCFLLERAWPEIEISEGEVVRILIPDHFLE